MIFIFWKKIAFREWQNSYSESDNTKIFCDKVPFTHKQLVGLMENNISSPIDASKKSIRVSFVTPGMK